jgi:hypothetical protein
MDIIRINADAIDMLSHGTKGDQKSVYESSKDKSIMICNILKSNIHLTFNSELNLSEIKKLLKVSEI